MNLVFQSPWPTRWFQVKLPLGCLFSNAVISLGCVQQEPFPDLLCLSEGIPPRDMVFRLIFSCRRTLCGNESPTYKADGVELLGEGWNPTSPAPSLPGASQAPLGPAGKAGPCSPLPRVWPGRLTVSSPDGFLSALPSMKRSPSCSGRSHFSKTGKRFNGLVSA